MREPLIGVPRLLDGRTVTEGRVELDYEEDHEGDYEQDHEEDHGQERL